MIRNRKIWRRRRDSNPGYAFGAYNGLANRRLQPLGHVSASVIQALSKLTATLKPKIGTGLAPDFFVSFVLCLTERTKLKLATATSRVAKLCYTPLKRRLAGVGANIFLWQ